jgi:hypothetical protein
MTFRGSPPPEHAVRHAILLREKHVLSCSGTGWKKRRKWPNRQAV